MALLSLERHSTFTVPILMQLCIYICTCELLGQSDRILNRSLLALITHLASPIQLLTLLEGVNRVCFFGMIPGKILNMIQDNP